MTLDEAIKRYTSNAFYEKSDGNLQGCLEFEQLAEWLKELKQLKEQEPCEDVISRADVKKYLSAPDANGDRVIYESDLDLLPSVTPQPRWIPVSERLPEEEGLYLVTVKNEHDRRYSKTCWFHGDGNWFARQDVIAWMPSPASYESKESEEKE